MRRTHLEALDPLCPVCRTRLERESRLNLSQIYRQLHEDDVVEGIVRCAEAACQREYPILDGVLYLIADLRAFVGAQLPALTAREDLSVEMESLLGDCAGPASPYDTARQQLSAYAWDHYGDLAPEEQAPIGERPGSIRRLLQQGLALVGDLPAGPVLDVGCATGRTSFDLAAHFGGSEPGRRVLGVDLNPTFLRLAAGVAGRGEARFPLRRVGLVYDRLQIQAALPGRDRADFWALDATDLPFAADTFALAISLNALDCMASPREALVSIARVLAPGGKAILATPYDWSPGATPVEAWLGGHSQRGPERGDSAAVLRTMVNGEHPGAVPGLRLVAEKDNLPWKVRLHDRSLSEYRLHMVVVEKASPSAPSA